MRLPVDRFGRLALTLGACFALSACGIFRGDYEGLAELAPAPPNAQVEYFAQASDAPAAQYSGTAFSSPAQRQAFAAERGARGLPQVQTPVERSDAPPVETSVAYAPPMSSLTEGAGISGRGTGPAADYPVVVGEPYRVGENLYTPSDTLNYDEVGHAVAEAGIGVTASHHTLPLPSYVEVTSLDTGRTILVRVERRGPMTSDALIALSPMAFNELNANHGAPVRVRRVNPQEFDREKLRSGQAAAARMDTPETLLTVLKRKLPAGTPQPPAPGSAAPAVASMRTLPSYPVPPSQANRELPAAMPVPNATQQAVARALPRPALPPLGSEPTPYRPATVVASLPQPPQQVSISASQYVPPAPQRVSPPVQQASLARPVQPAHQTPATAADGAFVVQVVALSSLSQARRVAGAIGGQVSQTGSLYRVRTGPFTTRGQAEASLAKVHAAGYSEARIFTNG